MVGWYNGSWGYRGCDGEVYGEGSKGSNSNYDAKYDQDAVIGCGINFDQHVAFYTKDGVVLGRFSPRTANSWAKEELTHSPCR